jgi:hypothetical protein
MENDISNENMDSTSADILIDDNDNTSATTYVSHTEDEINCNVRVPSPLPVPSPRMKRLHAAPPIVPARSPSPRDAAAPTELTSVDRPRELSVGSRNRIPPPVPTKPSPHKH